MYLSPPREEHALILRHNPHRAPNLVSLHSFDSDQLGPSVCPEKIDLRMTVSEHMDGCRFMIVDENRHAEAASANIVTTRPYNPMGLSRTAGGADDGETTARKVLLERTRDT
jgi:hypothetical protein